MAFGILEPQTREHVPGTVLLEIEDEEQENQTTALKKVTGSNAHIVLVPQPSDDPNDPLTWPLWQRDALFLLYAYCTILATGGIGLLLFSSALVLVETFGIDFTKVSNLTGYCLCATGACGIFISALAHKYGKRPTALFSVAMACAGTLRGGGSNSYNSLLGARFLQGFGVAMFESVMFAVVGDLYFVHERGSRMALLTTVTAGIANLPAMVAGLITERLVWRWMFWMLSIFYGIAFVLVILFGWETAYRRSALLNLDTSSKDDIQLNKDLGMRAYRKESRINKMSTNHKEDAAAAETDLTMQQTISQNPSYLRPRKSLVQRMQPFSGQYSNEGTLKMLIRPFAILSNPAVIWACLTLGVSTLWAIAISFTVAQIFSAPPFLLSTAELGYMSAGPVVGGTFGCLLLGFIGDPIVKWFAKRNHGVYEPEYRLALVIGMVALSSLGYFMFGSFIEQGKAATGIACVWAIIVASIMFASVIVGTYMVLVART